MLASHTRHVMAEFKNESMFFFEYVLFFENAYKNESNGSQRQYSFLNCYCDLRSPFEVKNTGRLLCINILKKS